MNINEILMQYDAMFGKKSLVEIEEYLVKNIFEAREKSEMGVLVTLLNEIIGFCRDTTQKDKALSYCSELQKLLVALQLEESIEYATSLLNIANAYRAFDLAKEAISLFVGVHEIYAEKIAANDFRYAGLYNNWSLAYQEMEDYDNAKKLLLKALDIVDSYEEAVIQQATTRTNLAATLLQIRTTDAYEEAIEYLSEALEIFERDGGKDFHYGAALVALGDAYSFKKEYDKAVIAYEKGLEEIERHVGRTDNYDRVLEKCNYARRFATKKEWLSNLTRSRRFYEKYGKEMIRIHFPGFEERIAVGLIGEGSDCFGFDDEISADHDYAVGFCMWLTEEDYSEIGELLQEEYDKLVYKYAADGANDRYLQKRRGVFSINDFYNQLLETSYNYEAGEITDFYDVQEFKLAAATNGEVFTDNLGIFSDVREKLQNYYPDVVWRGKLAQSIHEFSQYAQSNYVRMMARQDFLTAGLCVSKAIESVMDLMYLLNRTYAPYYKWKKKGLERFKISERILPLLEKLTKLPSQIDAWSDVKYSPTKLNTKDECVKLFEQVAAEILQKLKEIDLVCGEDLFLESYIRQILEGKNVDIIEKIIDLEWKQFDKVENEGGRADCQDDFETFQIMRKSQYLTWTEELLYSYCNDLLEANSKGRNLIMEKYARMMKSTAPERYAKFEDNLPALSEDRIVIQEEIIKIQVVWMEEFAYKYPKLAGNARSIRSSEDSAFNTSYETYLRGELGTYSENTFILYGRFIAGLLSEHRNLAFEIMENTARLYGYSSAEAAEEKLF